MRGELIVAWSRVVQVRNCSDFGCFEDRAYGICQCIGYGVYKTVRNVRPQGFWIEEIKIYWSEEARGTGLGWEYRRDSTQ